MLWVSHYYSYRLDYYRPSTSYRVELTSEGSIKSTEPILRTSQSASFGTHFYDNSQKLTFTCNNTLLSMVIIPLCYDESSLRISSWYVSPFFLYDPSNSNLSSPYRFNRCRFSYNSFLFSSHTLAWVCILHLKFWSMLVSFISQSLLNKIISIQLLLLFILSMLYK